MDFDEIARHYNLPSDETNRKMKEEIFAFESKGIYFKDHFKNIGIFPEYGTFKPGRQIYPHYHDFFEMILVIEGSGVEEIEGIKYNIEPGSLIFINHLTFHHLFADIRKPLKVLSVSFIPPLISEILKLDDSNDILSSFSLIEPFFYLSKNEKKYVFNLTESQSGRIVNNWLPLVHLYNMPNHNEWFYLLKNQFIALLSMIIYEYRQMTSNAPYSDNPISRVINHLHTNDILTITIEDMLSLAGLSKSYFYVKFKTETGTTFNNYINILKIQKAKTLLLSSSFSIMRIAVELDYDDPGYFHRLFKRITGKTPGQYRKENL